MRNNNIFMTIDFTEQTNKNKLWLENIRHRRHVYNSFSQYIDYLENLLVVETDKEQIYLIEKRIKKLKKHREMYYDADILTTKLPGKKYEKEIEPDKSKSLKKRLFNKKI